MLKKRIIPKFLLKEGRLVKAVRFHENFREAGNAVSTSKVYCSYGVDELIFLDISGKRENRERVFEILREVSEEVFMPLTAGGGIFSLEDIQSYLRAGADKVSINTAAVTNPAFIKEAATCFGKQCIVVSIDYKEVSPGVFRVFTENGTKATDLDPFDWSLRAQDYLCGEVLLSSIDRDGTMQGYDLELVERVSRELEVPVIASSGAGSLNDCKQALNCGAAAITISSMFFFTDHSPIKVRSYLWSQGVNVRASKNSRN